jgi:hypothetical protein
MPSLGCNDAGAAGVHAMRHAHVEPAMLDDDIEDEVAWDETPARGDA